MTPAMWACYYDRSQHLERLMSLGAKMNLKDEDDKTALHWSVMMGGTGCFRKLINYESSFVMDNKGKSVIHHAAEAGNKAAIKMCIRLRPACVHDVDNNGRTPLHWAAACNQVVAIRALIKRGSFVSRTDATGKTALDYVEAHAYAEATEILGMASDVEHKKPRMGPAAASTSLRAFQVAVPEGGTPPSEEARQLFKTLSVGMYLYKFANHGAGPMQKRYFWLDCFTGELCWAKTPKHFTKNPELASSAFLTDVVEGPREVVHGRSDYQPEEAHKFTFTLRANHRDLDVVATSEFEYRIWIEGLRCLKVFGEHILNVEDAAKLAQSPENSSPV